MSTDKHPDSVPALLSSLRELRETNPKAVRSTVHIYPVSLYASNGESSTSDSTSDRARGSSFSPTSAPAQDGRNGESSTNLRDRRITSWKMTEHMYFNAQNPFPTLARGLFTEEVEDEDPLPEQVARSGENGARPKDRIVARGYDKFFNIDEVAWTNWEAMRTHTQPPYHLTLKSNGCLILISALSPSHLVVASKHSLGTIIEPQGTAVDGAANDLATLSIDEKKNGETVKKNGKEKEGEKQPEDKAEHEEARAHAAVGRDWVRRTLAAKGKTEGQLAKKLWEGNMTAVLELCDDAFEEHVIATPAHWTGLHLHGLNHNTPHFSTSSPAEVKDFAEEFGFIQTKFVELQTLDEVKAFTDDVAKTGSWEGDMIEGFVVRSTVKPASDASASSSGRPPYRAGAPFFFKVKFDEPYLLYRQWRETTRLMLPLLSAKDPETRAKVWEKVHSRTRRAEVGVYAEWCGEMMKTDPKLFEGYEKGVVRVRESFLAWTEGEGKGRWEEARAAKGKKAPGKAENGKEKSREGLPKKWLIVPVAVPGCGKTLIGVALSKLFGFAHTQSDDITTKKTAPTFLKNITSLLQKEDVVYADRNNHILKHYNELATLSTSKQLSKYDLRLIAIVWDIDAHPYHRLLRICSERVVARGDNHQTLRPDPSVEAEHEAVVGQFLRNYTCPDPALFESLIDVRVISTPREALGRIVDSLVPLLGLSMPKDDEIDKALDEAASYRITTPYHQISKVGKPIRYFALAPEIDLAQVVEDILDSSFPSSLAEAEENESEAAKSARSFLERLKERKRVTAKPHVTLSHEKTVQEEEEAGSGSEPGTGPGPQKTLWDTCKALAEAKYSPLYEYKLTHLIWDRRVMALALSDLRPQAKPMPPSVLVSVATSSTVTEGKEKELDLDLDAVMPKDLRKVLHVTVGTANEDTAPFESRGLVRLLRERLDGQIVPQGAEGEGGEAEEVVEGGGKVRWVKIRGAIRGEGRVRGMF